MLSKLNFKKQLKTLYSRYLNIDKHFRVAVENENHQAMNNGEHFKYKQASENFLSSHQNAERLTSFVEKIQVLSTPPDSVKPSTMSEVAKDRLGQWPIKSESELAGQGVQRLKNGRFNKVSRRRSKKIARAENEKNRSKENSSDDCNVKSYETRKYARQCKSRCCNRLVANAEIVQSELCVCHFWRTGKFRECG